ncbi:MAG TPA: hypothetical protein VH591_12865 [Ktedonobacterales bacterium]|jgi:hypothetical protein
MDVARRGWAKRFAIGLAVALLFVLAGCDVGASVSRVSQRGQETPGPTPGGLIPTATTANITPIATANVQCKVRALPQGWSWYQDARYSFRLAVPPGWRTGSFEYVPDGSNVLTSPSHIHVVDFFGPGSVGQATSSGKMRGDGFSPVITIEVDVGSLTSPTPYGTGVMSNWYAQTTPVCIGKIPITPYLFTNVEGVAWAAVLPTGPGGYPYAFSVASDPATATRDGIFFQAALATFTVSP